MKIGTMDLKHVRGLTDKGLGLGKEVLGSVIGNQRWVDEGEAQQARGSEDLKALRAQAEADKHKAKAKAAESKQRTAQRVKENA